MAKTTQIAVHCPECSKLVSLPAGQGAGCKLKCPFCFAMFSVEETTVLIAKRLDTDGDPS